MELKPQDLLVALKLVALDGHWQPYHILAPALGLSPSQVHGAVQRALAARLLRPAARQPKPVHHHLQQFLLHGIRYVFVPERGGLTRGIATGFDSEVLPAHADLKRTIPWVWPVPGGPVEGEAFTPLHPAVPRAAGNDRTLHRLLVLVDAIRGGGVRTRERACDLLAEHLRSAPAGDRNARAGSVPGSK